MVPEKKTILNGIDLDADESRIAEDKAKFIKGLQYDINNNPNSQINKGDNVGVYTPYPGNILINQNFFPVGDNYCVGTYYSKEVNQLFVCVHNSNNNHLIYRITSAGVTQKVYQNPCLNFQRDPEHFILDGRCFIRKQLYIDHNGNEQYRVFFGFTDNYGDIRLISVEDSIATDSFNKTQFPYFNVPNAYSCSDCDLINLAVPHSMKCIGITPMDRTEESEKRKQNLTVNNGWQFRIRYIDVFGRRSAWGIISDLYMTILGGNCVQANNSLARCYRLNIDAGCPLVDKIEVAFSKNNGEWYLYDTIEKWDNCQNVPWYQRTINDPWQEEKTKLENEPDPPSPEEILEMIKYLTKYNSGDNTFDYTFCADKECLPIDVAETDMNFVPVPKASSSMGALNKGMFLYNNKREFEPLSCNELDKISLQVIPPQGLCEEELPTRTIVIYVPLVSPWAPDITYIWKSNVEGENYFQWGKGRPDNPKLGPNAYNQLFAPEDKGFLGYLAGTKYVAESEQVVLNLNTGVDSPFPPPTASVASIGNIARPFNAEDYPVQKFTFRVPPGIYSFRIAGHLRYGNDRVQYERTSTQTFGIIQMNDPFGKVGDFHDLIINCCDQDVILNGPTDQTIAIYDMSHNGMAWNGYLKENISGDVPVEYAGIQLATFGSGATYTPAYTDHNGHFWGFGIDKDSQMWLSPELCASPGAAIRVVPNGVFVEALFTDVGRVSILTTEWACKDRRYFKGKISVCDTDLGIGGVLVVCRNGPAVRTTSDGEFTILMHNKNTALYGATDLIFVSQSGGCRIYPCDEPCDACFSVYNGAYVACADCTTEPDGSETSNRVTSNINWFVGLLGNNKGLENGGRYGVGLTMHDWAGRHGAIQAHEDMYIDLPSMTETQVFGFSTVLFDMTGIVFPSWVKYVTFWVTQNLNNTDRMMWSVDKVEFIDSGGNVVGPSGGPTKIRIYYESLAEYNKQNDFATTTTWQIVNEETDGSVVGDYVEFIRNGAIAGTSGWFPGGVQAQVVYNKEGAYFDIEYLNDLQDLTAGALIKFVRPKDCIQKHIYYELCTTIRVNNGVPETYSGTLPAFDSYFINRQIPIPIYQTDANGNRTKTVRTEWSVNLFEHHSPSDFWGDHIWNRGRVNVKNPYEREIRNIQEIALSAALVDRSNFNGLNYFLPQDATSFEEQEWGAGVIAFAELNILLVICEHNNFVVGFKDNLLRIGPDNTVVGGAEGGFSNPQRKIGSDYGCQPKDINSIKRHMGLVYYVDRDRNALLQHDYSSAKDMSVFGYKGYLTKKIVAINPIQTGLNYYFTAGIHPLNNEYMLSVALMRGDGVDAQFINNQLAHSERVYETIAIDVFTGLLKGFPQFVPENYGIFPGHQQGAAMFTFTYGEPWNHTNNIPAGAPYNNFYNTQCKKVIEIVTNISPETAKKFAYNEVYCKEHKFIADRVLTEAGQLSRIKAPYWVNMNKFWAAPFLCNTLANFVDGTPAGKLITEGDRLFGRWIKVRYISEDADDDKYCELGGIVTYVILDEKSAE